jgi:hypothetical protein
MFQNQKFQQNKSIIERKMSTGRAMSFFEVMGDGLYCIPNFNGDPTKPMYELRVLVNNSVTAPLGRVTFSSAATHMPEETIQAQTNGVLFPVGSTFNNPIDLTDEPESNPPTPPHVYEIDEDDEDIEGGDADSEYSEPGLMVLGSESEESDSDSYEDDGEALAEYTDEEAEEELDMVTAWCDKTGRYVANTFRQ